MHCARCGALPPRTIQILHERQFMQSYVKLGYEKIERTGNTSNQPTDLWQTSPYKL